MKILKNKTTAYISANFTEDETAWSSASVYNYADEIRDGHYVYKYAGTSGTNTTDTPSVDVTLLTPSWVKIAPTNYYAMLDGDTSTQTQNANTIVIEISSVNYDSVALLELEAQSVTLELTDNSDASIVYTRTIDLNDATAVVDFYSYAFDEIVLSPSVYKDDVPLFSNATLKITIDNTGGTAKCGRLVFGRSLYVGRTGYGASLNMESFSIKDTDVFGNTSLSHRGSLNVDSYEVFVPTQKIPTLRRKFKELDAVAVLFVMDDSENSILENLLNFGYYQDFSVLIPDATTSTVSLQIKGIL